MRLRERVAIVTGAGAGNGRAIAMGLAAEGASVVLADIDLAAACRVAGEVAGQGGIALPVRVDVAQKAEVVAMVRSAEDRFNRIDILVNNAGVRGFASIVEMPEAEWDRHLDIDLKGPFLCIQAVAPIMLRQKRGKIVNITSGAAELALKEEAHYCAAKAGLKMLTRVAAAELAPHINVNAVGPGIVEDTGMFQDIRANPQRMADLQRRIPLGRFCSPFRDLVPLVVFLASDESDYLTGQSVYLEGGLLLGA